jgi:hypothetical protein
MNTGMKNYIANERGGWATSAGYIKFSFARSIHFGRVYTSASSGTRGKEADLCEALRYVVLILNCVNEINNHQQLSWPGTTLHGGFWSSHELH